MTVAYIRLDLKSQNYLNTFWFIHLQTSFNDNVDEKVSTFDYFDYLDYWQQLLEFGPLNTTLKENHKYYYVSLVQKNKTKMQAYVGVQTFNCHF